MYTKVLPDRSNKLDISLHRVTYSEGEAFDKLYEMMMKEIEREEAEEECRKKRLADEEKGLTAEEVQELREQRAVNAKKEKIEMVFFGNAFTWRRIGENREVFIIRNNVYCQVRYIKEKRAFVIVSADSKEDAIKGNLKIGTEYYYMDEPEKEMLHRLDEDVMTNYMK